MYIFVSRSFKKIAATFSQREEWCLNPAFCFEPSLAVSIIFDCKLHYIFLLLHNMCLGNNEGSAVYGNVKSCCRMWKYKTMFKYVPVKWRRCWCACCPLVFASFALFTQLAIRFSFWVTALLLCGLSCAVYASFHITLIGMRETLKLRENVLFDFFFF